MLGLVGMHLLMYKTPKKQANKFKSSNAPNTHYCIWRVFDEV